MNVGDKVSVFSGTGKTKRLTRIDTVTKITATQIITDRDRFNKDSLRQVSRFSHEFLVPFKSEHEQELHARQQVLEQNKRRREETEKRKQTLRNLFPNKFFPSISEDGDEVELSFKCSWQDAEKIATALRDAFGVLGREPG